VILSTHILPEVEAICQRVIIMHRGRSARCAARELHAAGRVSKRSLRAQARDVVAPPDVAREARP